MSFYCETCNSQVKKQHKARHLKTKKHLSILRGRSQGSVTALDSSGGDLQSSKVMSSIFKPFTTEKYPGERHLFRHNYTGPGTRLDIRLDENNNPKPGEEPVNRVDQAALSHDIAYNSEDIRDRHLADVNLIHDLNNIKNPSRGEKIQRALVKLAMKGKIFIGAGGNSIRSSLRSLMTTDSHWIMDLIHMPCKSIEGYKIILVIIDLDSRDVFARGVINKEYIPQALEEIFETTQRVPNYLSLDSSVIDSSVRGDLMTTDVILKAISKQEKRIIKEVVENIKNKFWEHFSSTRKQIWDNKLLDSVVIRLCVEVLSSH